MNTIESYKITSQKLCKNKLAKFFWYLVIVLVILSNMLNLSLIFDVFDFINDYGGINIGVLFSIIPMFFLFTISFLSFISVIKIHTSGFIWIGLISFSGILLVILTGGDVKLFGFLGSTVIIVYSIGIILFYSYIFYAYNRLGQES